MCVYVKGRFHKNKHRKACLQICTSPSHLWAQWFRFPAGDFAFGFTVIFKKKTLKSGFLKPNLIRGEAWLNIFAQYCILQVWLQRFLERDKTQYKYCFFKHLIVYELKIILDFSIYWAGDKTHIQWISDFYWSAEQKMLFTVCVLHM